MLYLHPIPWLRLPLSLPEPTLPPYANATYAALGHLLQELVIPEGTWHRGRIVNGHFMQHAGGEVRIGRVDTSRLSDGAQWSRPAAEFVLLREELLQLGRQGDGA